jgi:hypothetical protein
MGFEINWTASAGDPVLDHPYYQSFSYTVLDSIDENLVKAALAQCRPDRDGAAIISYLSWLLRAKQLLA